MLIRWHNGERKVWSVVRVPVGRGRGSPPVAPRADRPARPSGRRTSTRSRGCSPGWGWSRWSTSGSPGGWRRCGSGTASRSRRACSSGSSASSSGGSWSAVRSTSWRRSGGRRSADDATPQVEKVRRLLGLKGIGENGAWLLVEEFFGWRQIRNRRELGSLAGLTPTPYDSGESRREQGISKAGNRRVRWMMVQLAWGWLQVSARERAEPMVREAVRRGERAVAEGGDRGVGAEAAYPRGQTNKCDGRCHSPSTTWPCPRHVESLVHRIGRLSSSSRGQATVTYPPPPAVPPGPRPGADPDPLIGAGSGPPR